MAEKLRGRWLFASANVANHPLLSRLHARLGALLPFQLPTPDQATAPGQPTSLNAFGAAGLEPEQALRSMSPGGGSRAGDPHWRLPADFLPASNVLDDTPAAHSRYTLLPEVLVLEPSLLHAGACCSLLFTAALAGGS